MEGRAGRGVDESKLVSQVYPNEFVASHLPTRVILGRKRAGYGGRIEYSS